MAVSVSPNTNASARWAVVKKEVNEGTYKEKLADTPPATTPASGRNEPRPIGAVSQPDVAITAGKASTDARIDVANTLTTAHAGMAPLHHKIALLEAENKTLKAEKETLIAHHEVAALRAENAALRAGDDAHETRHEEAHGQYEGPPQKTPGRLKKGIQAIKNAFAKVPYGGTIGKGLLYTGAAVAGFQIGSHPLEALGMAESAIGTLMGLGSSAIGMLMKAGSSAMDLLSDSGLLNVLPGAAGAAVGIMAASSLLGRKSNPTSSSVQYAQPQPQLAQPAVAHNPAAAAPAPPATDHSEEPQLPDANKSEPPEPKQEIKNPISNLGYGKSKTD